MPVRGLTVVLATADADRLRTAFGLVCAAAALGGRARLFVDAVAVGPFGAALRMPGEARFAEAGLPTLAQLLDEALDLGVEVSLCQSGLHLAGATLADHDPRIVGGGLVGLLASSGEDRLVTV